jgi:hypothetical protein
LKIIVLVPGTNVPEVGSLHPLSGPTWFSDCMLFADNDYTIPIPGVRSCSFLTSQDSRILFPGSELFNSSSSDVNSPFRLPFLGRPENSLVIIPESNFSYNEIFVRIRNLHLKFELFDKVDISKENKNFYEAFKTLSDSIDFTNQDSLTE